MTTETLEIRQLAHQFAQSDLRPHVEAWDHDAAVPADIFTQIAGLGFFGMLVPEAFGGMEFDLETYVAAIEELAWGEAGVALAIANTSLVAALIAGYGADEQKRQWLERIAAGEIAASYAVAEDEAPVQVKPDGDAFVLNGTKRWVTNARNAKLMLLAAADSAFLIANDASGVTIGQRAATLGFRTVDVMTVELNDVRVEAAGRLALHADELVQGFDVGRLGIAAIAIGIAQAAFEHARDYANVREQFKQKLRAFEGIQFKLADMATRIAGARALLQTAAATPTLETTAMAKVFASEAAMWVTTQAVQIFGGYGYMRDYPVEKLMRDAKATELLQGPNEELRVAIAHELYVEEGR